MELKVTDYHITPEGVATIRLNRPGRGNSWTARMNQELRWVMQHLDQDPAARVIVLRGAGRQFCVGADFKALDFYAEGDKDYMATVDPSQWAQPGHGVRPEFEHELVWLWGLRKPVIAAVNGACAGIAVAIAGFCDLRYAIAGAKFTTVAPRIGLPAEYGLSWLLPRLMGVTHANDVLFSGRIFTAEEAQAMNFVNAVFTPEEFDAKIDEIALGLATTVSPGAAETTKRQIYADLMNDDVGASIQDSKARISHHMQHPDFKEGVRALQEKRTPRFAALPAGQG